MVQEQPLRQPIIGQTVSNMTFDIFHENNFKKVKLSDFHGRWIILFFYPADFTFVCPTELEELADNYDEIQKLNAEVISVSTDTVFTHKAWHDHSDAIKKVTFPMAADPTGNMSRALGVYLADEGLALRGTFILNPARQVMTMEVHNNALGRSTRELIRKLKAAQFVTSHSDKVCPASWDEHNETLTPGPDLVGKI